MLISQIWTTFLYIHAISAIFITPEQQKLLKTSEKVKRNVITDFHSQNNDHEELQSPTICDPDVNQLSGRLKAGNAKYFFWFFESRSTPSKDPLILWLSGGPGASSTLALLGENGPCTIENGQTKRNPFSWNAASNILWLDQPSGTGFSEGPYVTTEDEVSVNVNNFLENFFEVRPDLQELDFYIFGESFGGHYVPNVAKTVLAKKTGNLRGIAIGNGLTDPAVQEKSYIDMAFTGGSQEGGTVAGPLSDARTKAGMRMSLPACTYLIDKCNQDWELQWPSCVSANAVCSTQTQPIIESGINLYDIRRECNYSKYPLCYDFSQMTNYMNMPETQDALLGKGRRIHWETVNYDTNMRLQADMMRSYADIIPNLLESGIRVLIYAGDADFICNFIGNKHWMSKLEWKEWNKAEDQEVSLGENPVGRVKEDSGLIFFQVYQAGHMVPMDQPQTSLELVFWFTGQANQFRGLNNS